VSPDTIAALLPSRGRPASLATSIESLRSLAHQPERVDVLVAADPDDPDTVAAADQCHAAVWVASERYGYSRLHEYINALASMSSARWLLLWNDDAHMLTPGWDERIAEAPAGVLWPRHNGSPHLNVFPVVHRTVVETLGHFSLSPHCDSWMQDVATAAGIHHKVNIEVLHDRFDLTGGHDDQTYQDAQAGYRTSEYHSPEMVALRQRDIDLLASKRGTA
jgi:hypothetical protein